MDLRPVLHKVLTSMQIHNSQRRIMKRVLMGFFAAILLVVGLTGCNTMQGAGEDIEDAGEAIQDTAR